MSIAVSALRIATVKALQEATSAGKRVFDSAVDPVDLLDEAAAPTVAVYTDRGKRMVQGRDIHGADHSVELSIEMFVAKASIVKGRFGLSNAEYEFEYPANDAMHENRLQRLAYEIVSVLTGELSPWAEMWKRLAVNVSDEAEWDRGADATKGRRFNFLRLTFRVDTLCDPPRGQPLEQVWLDLLAMMDADPELADLAADWRALMTTPSLPAWRKAMSELGATYQETKAIGLAPLLDHQASDTAEAAPQIEIIVDGSVISPEPDPLSPIIVSND